MKVVKALLIAITAGLACSSAYAEPSIQLQCSDSTAFMKIAEDAYSSITNRIQRCRELAIQAANGTLGASDREYLEMEYSALKDQIDLIATNVWAGGSDSADHYFLRDGMSFDLMFQHTNTHLSYTKHFDIKPLKLTGLGAMGAIAEQQFTPYMLDEPSRGSLIINGVKIDAPTKEDDDISDQKRFNSAIALAKVVNEKSGSTRVFADIQENLVPVGIISEDALRSFSGLSTDDPSVQLKINGYTIIGANIHGVPDLISLINKYSASTGVSARLAVGSTDRMELVAHDDVIFLFG